MPARAAPGAVSDDLLVRRAGEALPGVCALVLDTDLRVRAVLGVAAGVPSLDAARLTGRHAAAGLPEHWWGALRQCCAAALDGDATSVVLDAGAGAAAAAEARIAPVRVEGRVAGVVVGVRDVTRERDAVRALLRSEELHRLIASTSGDVVLRTALDGRCSAVTGNVRRLCGLRPQEVVGETVVALVHPDDRTALAAAEDDARAVRHAVQLEHRVRRRDGGWLWVEARIVGDRDRAGRLTGLRIAWRDVEERRRRDAELRHQATHDPLTGLWNRGRFREELDRCVAEARRYGQPTALMLLDLDGFKAVNDRFGHDAGDRHLEAVAQSIRAAVRASDHCARVGGDEFAVLLPHATFDEARVAAERIVAGVAALGLTRASIGVAIVGASGDGAAWLRRADDAMYVAKRAGGDRVAHAP